MAERNGLLNRRRGQTLPRVRIPLSPPFLYSKMTNEAALVRRSLGEGGRLHFTVRSTTSLKSRRLFFTSSPVPEALIVKPLPEKFERDAGQKAPAMF